MNIVKLVKRKILSYKKLIAKYKAEDTIFIYQMGKVGSTTLEHSLPNAIHIHAFFTKNHTCPVRLHGLAKFGFKYFFYRADQELTQFLLRRAFKKRKHTKIITLVRDPLARNISMFFHDLDAYLFSAYTNCLNTRERALATRDQQTNILVNIFNHEFEHQYPLRWFDDELQQMTAINIYDHAFDIEQGYGFVKSNNIELMIIRTDKLKNIAGELSDFVQQPVQILSTNKAEDKWYAVLYQEFCQRYKLSEPLRKELQASKYYQKFFQP